MSEQRTCPNCREVVPADAPAGVCPACALRAGFDPTEVGETATRSSASAGGAGELSAEVLADRLPELEAFELLGAGGMGAVYRARHRKLDRAVAVKVLDPALRDNATFAERFEREARALAHLDHPNVVRVYDFGTRDDLFYLIMELVDGVNLRQMIEAGGLQPAEALAMVPRVCEALQYAHDRGVVHRDIKPENILIDREGAVKIADFGLAKIAGGRAGKRLTQTRQVMGTPHYMAPEQIERPTEVDHRADIFALGVVFYELLTGELPVGRFPVPSKKVQVDVRLDDVVLRALEKEPDLRYQQVSEMRSDVVSVATGEGGATGEQGADGAGRQGGAGRAKPPTGRTADPLRDIADELADDLTGDLDGDLDGDPDDYRWVWTWGTTGRSARESSAPRPDYEYRSRRTLFGLPLIHIASSRDPNGVRMRAASGIIAIGDIAVGLVAIGAFSFGGIAFGGMSIGLVSVSGIAVGLLAALGGVAFGAFAAGGFASGFAARGSLALSMLEGTPLELVTLAGWALLTVGVTIGVAAAAYAWVRATVARTEH